MFLQFSIFSRFSVRQWMMVLFQVLLLYANVAVYFEYFYVSMFVSLERFSRVHKLNLLNYAATYEFALTLNALVAGCKELYSVH